MAKKEIKYCENCIHNGTKCQHFTNKGIVVKYRVEREEYFKTPDEINEDGKCKNYVEIPKK